MESNNLFCAKSMATLILDLKILSLNSKLVSQFIKCFSFLLKFIYSFSNNLFNIYYVLQLRGSKMGNARMNVTLSLILS